MGTWQRLHVRTRWALVMLGLTVGMLPFGGEAVASEGRAVSLSGTLEVDHGDNLKTGRSSYTSYLRTSNGKRLRLKLSGSAIEHAGDRATLRGRQTGNVVSVDSASYRQSRSASASSNGPGERKVAVFLINFQNDTSEPFGTSQGHSNVSTINDFYSEESSGQLTYTGDVFPQWITLPYSNSSCDHNRWAADARAYADAHGFDTAGYDNYEFIIRMAFPSSCWWAGLAQIGGPYVWINDYSALNLPSTLIHEFGHALTLVHSVSANCGISDRIPLSTNTQADCESNEYGDPFDVMGTSSFQNNGVQKKNLAIAQGVPGFFSGDILPVDSEGTYTISPAEPGFAGNELLEIPTRSDSVPHTGYQNYYVDFRQPYGLFDNFSLTSSLAKGVVIRQAMPGSSYNPRLIDQTPGDRGFDPVLNVDETFVDFDADFAIRTISTAASGAEVQVTKNLAGTVFRANSAIAYEARAGEANDVTVAHSGGAYTLTDRGVVSIEPGFGCEATGDPQTISCPEAGINSTTIHLGDGDDHFSGDDEADRVDAGLGDDTFAGGAGIDTVDYLDRTKPVRVDLDGRIGDDGQGGEHDTIGSDVENATGGTGKDKLTGNDGANLLDGWGGNDRIFGLGGNDVIRGDSGRNTIDGGAGDDTMTSTIYGRDVLKGGLDNDTFRTWDRDNLDKIFCGDGPSDSVLGDLYDRFTAKDTCETVTLR